MDENTYRIYDYAKEHPGACLTIGSAGIAAGSFLLRALLSFMNYNYIRYWKLSPELPLDSGKGLYLLGSCFVMLTAEAMYLAYLEAVAKPFYQTLQEIGKTKAVMRAVQRAIAEQQTIKKKAKELKGKAKKIPQKNPEYATVVKEAHDLHRDITQRYRKLREIKWELRGIQCLLHLSCFLRMIGNLLIPFVLFQLTVSMLWMLSGPDTAAGKVLFCIPLTITVINLSFPLLFHREEKKIPETTSEKECTDKEESIDIDIDVFRSAVKSVWECDYPRDVLHKQGVRKVMNDRLLMKLGRSIARAGGVMLIVFAGLFLSTPSMQTDYAVIKGPHGLYAVMYQNIDHSLLEPAAIEGDILYINPSHQIILEDVSLDYEVKHFRKVIRVEEGAETEGFSGKDGGSWK